MLRALGPVVREPEMIVFVSTTSFTLAPFLARRFYLGGDFGFGHGLAWLRPDGGKQVVKSSGSLPTAQFGGEQIAQRRRIAQN